MSVPKKKKKHYHFNSAIKLVCHETVSFIVCTNEHMPHKSTCTKSAVHCVVQVVFSLPIKSVQNDTLMPKK